MTAPDAPLDPSVFEQYLVRTRWFGGKGREWTGITEEGFFLQESAPAVSEST